MLVAHQIGYYIDFDYYHLLLKLKMEEDNCFDCSRNTCLTDSDYSRNMCSADFDYLKNMCLTDFDMDLDKNMNSVEEQLEHL